MNARIPHAPFDNEASDRPVVLIIGGGFGGLAAARALAKAPVQIILLDRTNHHTFQPLLYQVATAGLTTANIAQPIRSILRNQRNIEVLLENVISIDPDQRTVYGTDRSFHYDYLILATGARHSYFGNKDWEAIAPGLKTTADALRIRQNILLTFELAEKAQTELERKAAQTFVVVGGGPTGVEMAGAIAELARFTLRRDFRHMNPEDTRVILVEAGPEILSSFAPHLSESARRQLKALGVEVHLGKPVSHIAPDHVIIQDERIDTRTVIWAAGNVASPLASMIGCPLDRQARAIVNADLTVPGRPEIQAIGDLASLKFDGDRPVPGVAPAALQTGTHAGQNILRQLRGEDPLPFQYFDKGNLATIGRNAAIAEIGGLRMTGFPAFLIWAFVHLLFLLGFRNRLFVFLNWTFLYFTYSRGARVFNTPPDTP